MVKLKRLTNEPILKPDRSHDWEQKAVFNTAAVYKEGLIHLLYRASDNGFHQNLKQPDSERKFVSSIGYAVSADGINFNRMLKPVFTGRTEQEEWGVED